MKKVLSFLFLTLFTIVMYAQPSITYSLMPVAGENWIYHPVDSASIQPGSGGASQTWDFHTAGVHYNPFGYTFMTPQATLLDSGFSIATFAMEDNAQSGTFHFHQTSANNMIYLGFAEEFKRMIFTNPLTMYSFPFTYNTLTSDNYSGTADVSGMTLNQSGTYSARGDGYGTLILPTKTINNVLRVKIIHNFSQEFVGTVNYTYEIEEYLWFDGVHKQPLLKVNSTKTYQDTALSLILKSVSISGYAAGINQPLADELNFAVYPNPANSFSNLTYDVRNTSNSEIVIINSIGQEVKRVELGLQSPGHYLQNIDLSDLKSGCYHLKFISGDQVITQRIIKQ